jgi:tetratricopeptide (TPR) repeat protein
MPRRSVDRISHSALTNHRIPARPEAPVKRAPPEPASTALRGVVLLNARKGEPPLPVVTRLAAYGELMAKDPGLAQPYFAVLEEARRSAGEDPLVLAALGRKALAEGGADAVALLERAEQKGAAGSATRIDLGQALARAGRIGDSAAALERAAADYPYSMEIRKHLILTYIQQKAYPKAKTALEAYVRDFPEDAFMRGLLNQVSR